MRTDRFLSRLVGVAAAVAALAAAPLSQAQVSNYWNGTVSGDLFTAGANWVDAFTAGGPAAVPSGNVVAVFSSSLLGVDTNSGPRITNAVIIDSDVAFGRLLITSNGLATGIEPTAYRFGGAGLITLNGDGTGSAAGNEVITVALGNNAHNPAISNNINIALAGGRISVSAARTLTVSGNIGGAGTQLITTNTGTLRLTGSNLFTGGIRTGSGGTVNVNAEAGLGIAPGVFTPGYISLWNGSTLVINTNATSTGGGLDGGNFTINSNIGITIGHTAAGAATLNINNGTVSISSDGQLVGFGGVGGTNRLLKAGNGTLSLSGVQNINRWRLTAGTVQANNELALGAVPGAPVFDYFQITNVGGLTLNFTGALEANRGIALGFTNNNNPWTAGINVAGATNVVTYAGIIQNMTPTGGAGAAHDANFVKGGPGTLVLSGANTYTGITRIDAGYLTEDSITSIPGGAADIVYNGGGLRVDTDYTLGSPNITIGSNNNARAVFNVEAGATLTFNGGVIQNHTNAAGANNIISKNGLGTMILGGNLNHFGGVEASNGVLVLQGNNTYNGVSQAIGANSRLSIGAVNNLGTNTIILNNGGLLATESMTFGPADQRIQVGAANGNNSAIFEVAASKTLTINSVLSNQHTNGVAAGGITKLGAGTLELGAVNTYGGNTTIREGTVSVLVSEALGSQAQGFNVVLGTNITGRDAGIATNLVISQGSLVLNGTTQTVRAVTLADNNAATTPGSTANISGPGLLILQNNLTYNAGTGLDAGGATISANIALGAGNRTITVDDSTATASDLTISGAIGGDVDAGVVIPGRTLTKAGLGTLVLASAPGANSFSNLTVNAGTVRLGANDQLPNGRSVTVQSSIVAGNGTAGILDIAGNTDTIGALTVGGGTAPGIQNALVIDSVGGGLLTLGGGLTYAVGAATNNSGTATISANLDLGAANRTANIGNSANAAIDLNITGNISGAARTLTVTNSGTLRLAGANTFAALVVSNSVAGGPTVLNDGTHTGSVTVGANGTFGGSGTVSGALTVIDGGTLAPGSSPGTLTVGDLNLASGAGLNFELNDAGIVGGGINDLIVVNGNLTLDGTLNVDGLANFGGGIYRLINYTGTLTDNGLDIGLLTGNAAGFAGGLSIDTTTAGQVNLVVVPEPSTVALAGIGAALLGLHVIRRRNRR